MKEKIGENAGRLWNALNENGEKSVKELKKALKLTDKDIYAAMGWLAREEKLAINENGAEVILSLI